MRLIRPSTRALLGTTLLGALAACGAPARPRGVLLVSIDSLRADHLGCYGYASETRPDVRTSPMIDDRLAARGTRFEKVVSTTSWTLPAHMALLTGLPDELHKVQDYPDRLHESRRLVTEVFQDAGWATFGAWSGPNLHPAFGFGRGFERYVDCSSAVVVDPDVFDVDRESARDVWSIQDLHQRSHQGETSTALVAAFEAWFEERDEDRPFFAFVHMWDVHYDYVPPPGFDVFYPEYDGSIDGHGIDELRLTLPILEKDVNQLKALYDGELRWTDSNVGRLLDVLERSGALDDTIVVLTSDHGDEFFEHGQLKHRDTLFEEVVRIPLIVSWPAGVPSGRSVDGLASITDVAPTLLELCGLPRPAGMWGRSLAPALHGELPARAAPMSLVRRGDGLILRGAHGDDHKFVRDDRLGGLGLYRLDRDPLERLQYRVDAGALAPDHPRLAGLVDFWGELDDLARDLPRDATGELDEEHLRALEAFGYGGSDEDEDEEQ